jgi:hypothetical protein
MLINGEIEATAQRLLREAGLPVTERPNPDQLARRLLGSPVRLVPPHVLRREAALARVSGQWWVFLRSDLAGERRAFALLHEVAHWAIGATAAEDRCDALAAAMLAPRPAFLQALERHGSLQTLARAFATTESCVALRLGEATGRPLALVTPSSVRLRGAAYSWPSERDLRSRTALPGIKRARLRDDRTRAILTAS